MNTLRLPLACRGFAVLVLSLATASFAADAPSATSSQILTAAAQQQKFTCLLLWKQQDAATNNFVKNLQELTPARADRTLVAYVNVTDPAEQEVLKQFKAERAPTPMVLVVAPNGAVTGFFHQPMTEPQIEKALVTPTMTKCMKAMQDGKIVLVCASASKAAALPAGAQEFLADPAFQQRAVMVRLPLADPAEERFVRELQLDTNDPLPQTVMLAPPGLLVGRFNSMATKADIASKLHAAGKCCDDPNCKHGK